MPPYAPGQVWTYRTRPQDPDSRVKIQMVETDPHALPGEDGQVFHVSIIGLNFANPEVKGEIAHAPMAHSALAASLLAPAEADKAFPDPAEGVASWKEGEGGVFTVTLAELAQMFDDVTAGFVPTEGENLYFQSEWNHDRPDDPLWVMYEVDPQGRVLRLIQGFAEGGYLVALEDFEDTPDELPQPGSLIAGNFFEVWKDVPLGVPHGDDGSGEHVILTERPRAEFETIWQDNRG